MKNNSQWMVAGNNTFKVCGPTREQLPPGAYSCSTDCYGHAVFEGRKLLVDELIDFPGSLPSTILSEVGRFWTLGKRFESFGFLHRRGYLLYGKQGSGKSSLIHQVICQIVQSGHVAFFCQNPYEFVTCAQEFRKVEPDRPIACVFEDIDALIDNFGDQHLLQWLDGNFQVSKAVNIATTNYPEKLDPRIVARPRRFDRILRIDPPNALLREGYLKKKLPGQPAAERELWVELTEGLSFAALAELIISVCCLDQNLEDAVDRLQMLDEQHPSSDEFYKFTTNGADLVRSEN